MFNQKSADRITKVCLVLSGWVTSEWTGPPQQYVLVFGLWQEVLTGYGWNPHAARNLCLQSRRI